VGVLKIVPNNGGSVTLTSVLDSARAAITLYSDAARSTAVTLPATVSGSTKLYPPVTYAGQLWLKASAPGGVVVTGSGATALPEYDVVRIQLLDSNVTEAPVGPPDAGVAPGRVVYGGTP